MPIESDFQSHHEALYNSGIMVLSGSIDTDSVKPVIEWILYENLVRKRRLKELKLVICSDGGDLTAAFSLCDVMLSSAIPIKTIGLGSIASSSFMIFLCGAKGKRTLTPNTSIMSHQHTWETSGKVHELFSTLEESSRSHARMIALYKKTTGLSEEKIKQLLLPAHDVYISAEEALKYNICDVIADL